MKKIDIGVGYIRERRVFCPKLNKWVSLKKCRACFYYLGEENQKVVCGFENGKNFEPVPMLKRIESVYDEMRDLQDRITKMQKDIVKFMKNGGET